MKKILYTSPLDISRSDGPGINEREFVFELQKRFGESLSLLIPQPSQPAALAGLRNVQTFGYTKGKLRFIVGRIMQAIALRREVAKSQPELIVLRPGQLPFALAWILPRLGVPAVVKTQGDPTLTYFRSNPGIIGFAARCLAKLNDRASRKLLSYAAVVDVCTPQLLQLNRAMVSKEHTSKIIHIENATNVKRFRPLERGICRAYLGLESFGLTRIIGYVGGMPWERGGMQILNAVASLKGEYPDLGCVIVGGYGPGLDTLHRRAKELGIEDRCCIPGMVPYEEVVYWINYMDVAVAFDRPEFLQRIGSSNQKIRQYLACGKPVIAGAGTSEFIENERFGYLLHPSDNERFKICVRRLLDMDEVTSEGLAKRARRFAEENFSIEALVDVRLSFWEERVGCQMPNRSSKGKSSPLSELG